MTQIQPGKPPYSPITHTQRVLIAIRNHAQSTEAVSSMTDDPTQVDPVSKTKGRLCFTFMGSTVYA